jgi:hypothetical protein
VNKKTVIKRIILVAIALYSTWCFSQEFQNLTKLEKTVISATGTVVKVFREKHDQIWPGYDLSKQPFMVYIPGKWALLVNSKNPVEGFVEYPEDWPDIHTDAMLHKGDLKGLSGQLAFNFKIDTITTLAIGLHENFYNLNTTEGLLEIFAFITHESFHQFQRQSFGEIPWARAEKYPILDAENTAMAYLEMKLLIDALKAKDAGDKEKCREIVKDFALVRQNRWKTADEFVRRYEQGQELNEGTAKYVEVKSVFCLMEMIENDEHLDFEDSLLSSKMKNYIYDSFQSKMLGQTISPDDMIRNRIYPVGAAEGIMMDYIGIDWKNDATEAGTGFAFADLVCKSLCIDGKTDTGSLAAVKQDYDYDDVLAATKQEIENYIDLYQAEQESFENQEGSRIEVNLTYHSLSRAGNSRSKKWIMGNGAESLCMNYKLLKIVTDHHSFLLEDLAVYQQYDWDQKKIKIVFFTPRELQFIVDGEAHFIHSLKDQQFSELAILGEGIEVKVQSKGKMAATGAGITVTEEDE